MADVDLIDQLAQLAQLAQFTPVAAFSIVIVVAGIASIGVPVALVLGSRFVRLTRTQRDDLIRLVAAVRRR